MMMTMTGDVASTNNNDDSNNNHNDEEEGTSSRKSRNAASTSTKSIQILEGKEDDDDDAAAAATEKEDDEEQLIIGPQEDECEEVPATLQNFLFNVGVISRGESGGLSASTSSLAAATATATATAASNRSSSAVNNTTSSSSASNRSRSSTMRASNLWSIEADSINAAAQAAAQEELIFESALDLTEERLQHVFAMFDTDDDGLISYASLRRGIELHTASVAAGNSSSSGSGGDNNSNGTGTLDEASFHQLCLHLDMDKSGDITYEEFSEGLRLLMLRSLVFHSQSSTTPQSSSSPQQQPLPRPSSMDYAEGTATTSSSPLQPNNINPTDEMMVEVIDYDANRLERYIVQNDQKNRTTTPSSFSFSSTLDHNNNNNTNNNHIKEMKVSDFYFQPRPIWIKSRWINVSGPSSSLTMKRLAIKYMLHPLALEDAISSELHRPKAEVYSNHYFIMIPVFYVLPPSSSSNENSSASHRGGDGRWGWISKFLNAASGSNGSGNEEGIKRRTSILQDFKSDRSMGMSSNIPVGTSTTTTDGSSRRPQQTVGQICFQMTSIFVNVPKNDTIITYNNDEFYHGGGSHYHHHHHHDFNDEGFIIPQRQPPILPPPSERSQCWLRVQRELEKSYSKLRQYDAQYLTYALLDQAVDRIGPIVKACQRDLNLEKKRVQNGKFHNLVRIHALRRELERVARTLKPFTRLLVHVIEDEAISPGATVYLRDVLDNLEGHDDEVKQLIIECHGVDSEAEKYQARQMDQTLYTLTVISAVFLPAQFLTGVWGMNFVHMPELDKRWGYTMFWSLAVFLMVLVLVALNFGRFRHGY